jgi:hypothetical protein
MFGRHRAEEQRLPLIDVRQQQAMGPRLNSAMNYFPLNGRSIVTQLCMVALFEIWNKQRHATLGRRSRFAVKSSHMPRPRAFDRILLIQVSTIR